MNQILSTNETNSSSRIDVRTIVRIFCLSVIIMSVFIIVLSSYKLYSNIKKRKEFVKPEIEITRNDIQKVAVKVNCMDGIDYIIYTWNEKDTNRVNVNGSITFNKLIDIPYNKNNVLKVQVMSVNNIGIKATQEFTVPVDEEKPDIEPITTTGSSLNVNATDNSGIDYVEYQWENEEAKRIDVEPTDNKTINTKIDIKRGTHELKIAVVDIHGNKAETSKLITGVNEPEIEVIQYNNVVSIKLTHDMGIKQAVVLINNKLYKYNETYSEYNREEKDVQLEYPLNEGENIVKIIAYSFEKLTDDDNEAISNFARKTYVGKCTYQVNE